MTEFYLTHEREGDRLSANGQFDGARVAYERALELNPSARWLKAKLERLETPLAPREAGPADRHVPGPLFLFMPFYTPADPERAAELQYCLEQNLASGLFARIVLLIDDDTVLPQADRRVQIIRMDRRPTYLDWVRESRRLCPDDISILANSDIFFDQSVAKLHEIFASDPKAFIALSRFDKQGDERVGHPNPHWSQDAWAFRPRDSGEIADGRLDVPLGVPRCDNKIAYVFATQGFTVYNPFPFVSSIHVHETNLRYYSKKGDRRILGGVAMVYPGATLNEPASLEFQIWSEATGQVTKVALNRTLEKWAEEERLAAEPRQAWVAYDAEWQYPAITERYAFERMRSLLPGDAGQYDTVYLGFPFATLTDLYVQLGPTNPRTRALEAKLEELVPRLKRYSRVVTVAQHIHAHRVPNFFAAAGVTDLFWSHCATDKSVFPEASSMRLHPFPLFPVQQVPSDESDFDRERRWLFSFVGARASKSYLTDTRNKIIDILGDDQRGKVIDRDAWHYQKIVYDAQVLAKTTEDAPGLVNEGHAADFREILNDSIFSLCPSGSGPNSIRLWESMLNGSVPVIMADSWAAPGPAELWEAATIRCAETPAAIAALPHRLAKLAADPEGMRERRMALAKLTQRYGPDSFVTDIVELMLPEKTAPIIKNVLLEAGGVT